MTLWVSGLAVVGVAWPCGAQSQVEREPMPLQRITGAIVLDGHLDEPAWARLDTLPLVAYEPVAGERPSERTVFRIGYDDRFLYVGAELYDSRPDRITANTYTRDRWANDDLVEVVLDTYNDNQTGVIFSVNPLGARMDAQVSADAEMTHGFPINRSWDTFWDAATRRTEAGWTVEIRIPFSSLRFQTRDGRVVMGLILSRYIARKNETVTFPAIAPSWNLGYNKPSQARDVVLAGLQPARPVYVSPYALGGMERLREPSEAGAAGPIDSSREAALGLDLRHALTDNLNLDLTLNPDFAQAEADDQQVNLDRFSLFFPEKRPFFQERAGIFEFRTGEGNRLFHSRRIGIVDGRRIPIYGGGRLVGRYGPWDVGLLGMQTVATDDGISENFTVARARRQVVNPFSFVGGMLTTRLGDRTNVAWGLDGTIRLRGSTYAAFDWAGSREAGRSGVAASTGRLMLEDRSREGLGYQLSLGRAGEAFNPGIGFVQRTDYREMTGELRYNELPGSGSAIQRIGPRLEARYLTRDRDGGFETSELTVGGDIETRSGFTARGGLTHTREELRDGFIIEGATEVPAGRYDFTWARLFLVTPGARALHASMFARVGGFFDGTISSVTLSPRWRLSPHLLWGADAEHNAVRFDARDQGFTANIVRLRATVSVNTRLSGDAFIQYGSHDRGALGNFRVRFNPSEGRDLWLVYNETRETADEAPGRWLPEPRGRTLLIKYVHTFGI